MDKRTQVDMRTEEEIRADIEKIKEEYSRHYVETFQDDDCGT